MAAEGKRRIAVIGNGIIGHGIAEIFACGGWQVILVGRSKASLAAALDKIAAFGAGAGTAMIYAGVR